MRFLEKCFSVKNCPDGIRKQVTVMGLRFKFKKELLWGYDKRAYSLLEYYRVKGFSPVSSVYSQIESVVQTALMHQKSFGDLRYVNCGREVVVCASGPTLDYYEPIENAIHIGVKDVFKLENVKFDYLFHHDSSGYENKIIPVEFIMYSGKDCIKFIGNGEKFLVGEDVENLNVRFFNSANSLNYQIDYFPLPDYCSIVFAAFAFALWTKPKRIYLVGADCSTGYAKNVNLKRKVDARPLLNGWTFMKNFVQTYYPDVEIISINPVGLKGMFKDIYTENYLKEVE